MTERDRADALEQHADELSARLDELEVEVLRIDTTTSPPADTSELMRIASALRIITAGLRLDARDARSSTPLRLVRDEATT